MYVQISHKQLPIPLSVCHICNRSTAKRLPSLAFIGFMSCILYGIYITCTNACIHVYMYTYIVNFKISINFKISWWKIDTFTEMMYFMHFSNNEYAFFLLVWLLLCYQICDCIFYHMLYFIMLSQKWLNKDDQSITMKTIVEILKQTFIL